MNPDLKEFQLSKPIKVKRARKGIRKRTPKRAREERIYRARVKEWLVGKFCFGHASRHLGLEIATQNHHYFGRRGRLLLWEDGWIPVCVSCQEWIHSNIEQAREANLICVKGQWNNQSLVPKE